MKTAAVALGIVSALALAVAALAVFARQAFYYPDAVDYGNPAQAGFAYEEVYFDSRDGTRLYGWFVPAQGVAHPKEALGTVIHFHGNAQNLSAHWHGAAFLPAQGFNLFLFDYRGYGPSQGKPNQQGLFLDSNAALDYLRGRADIDADKLLVFGQSLGGNNAIAAVGTGNRAGIRAIVIEATFSSYSAIANDKVSGAGLLLGDRYAAERHIAALAPIPLLLIHGSDDRVIPAKHSQRLFELAEPPKQLRLLPKGGHLNLAHTSPDYENLIADFFREALSFDTPQAISP